MDKATWLNLGQQRHLRPGQLPGNHSGEPDLVPFPERRSHQVHGGGKASDPTPFGDGNWHHVCIVYFKNNGKQDLRIYADGEKLVEANGKDDKGTLTLPYYIGCNLRLTNGEWAPENMFTGWMDD